MDCLILIANLEDILHAGLDGMQEEEGVLCGCVCGGRKYAGYLLKPQTGLSNKEKEKDDKNPSLYESRGCS